MDSIDSTLQFRNSYLSDYTFSSFGSGPSRVSAIKACHKFIKYFDRYDFLYIHGPVGIGSSHLTGATANELTKKFMDLNVVVFSPTAPSPLNSFRQHADLIIISNIGPLVKFHGGEFFESIQYFKQKRIPVIVNSDRIWPEMVEFLRETNIRYLISRIRPPGKLERIKIAKSIFNQMRFKYAKMDVYISEKEIVAASRQKHPRAMEMEFRKLYILKEMNWSQP